jgi:hypothetical protein
LKLGGDYEFIERCPNVAPGLTVRPMKNEVRTSLLFGSLVSIASRPWAGNGSIGAGSSLRGNRSRLALNAQETVFEGHVRGVQHPLLAKD